MGRERRFFHNYEGMLMGIYYSHPSGGPCWSRERGYHQPPPLPAHIMRILVTSSESASPVRIVNDEYRCFVGVRDDISREAP